MSLTLPPREHPVLDDNGLITERWFEYLTRGGRGTLSSDAKFWAYVTVSGGTPTLEVSYNVASITDTGVGQMTVTILKDFASANWAPVVTAGSAATAVIGTYGEPPTAGSVLAISRRPTTEAVTDPGSYGVAGFGEQ